MPLREFTVLDRRTNQPGPRIRLETESIAVCCDNGASADGLPTVAVWIRGVATAPQAGFAPGHGKTPLAGQLGPPTMILVADYATFPDTPSPAPAPEPNPAPPAS